MANSKRRLLLADIGISSVWPIWPVCGFWVGSSNFNEFLPHKKELVEGDVKRRKVVVAPARVRRVIDSFSLRRTHEFKDHANSVGMRKRDKDRIGTGTDNQTGIFYP